MSNERILLVDDNSEDRLLFVLACEKAGMRHKIDEVRDGQEALDYLLGNNGYPHKPAPALTILDLKMPRVGGLETLRAARAHPRLKHLAFVILTSSDEVRDRNEAALLGAAIFFTKPSDLKGYIQLAKKIAHMLAHFE